MHLNVTGRNISANIVDTKEPTLSSAITVSGISGYASTIRKRREKSNGSSGKWINVSGK